MTSLSAVTTAIQLVCWLGASPTPPKLVADASPIDHGISVTHRAPYGTTTEFSIPCAVRWDLVDSPASEPASALLQIACYDHLGNVVLRDFTYSVSRPTPGTLAWDNAFGDGHILTNLECVVDEEP